MFACLADFSLFLKIFVINRFLAVTFQNLAGILRGFPPLISATVRIQFDKVLFGERLKKCRFEVCFNFSADNDVTTSSWNYSEFLSSFVHFFYEIKIDILLAFSFVLLYKSIETIILNVCYLKLFNYKYTYLRT